MNSGREKRDTPKTAALADSVAKVRVPESTTLPRSNRISDTPNGQRLGTGLPPMPPSYFAPAERATREALFESVERVANSRIVNALLRSTTTMMCILNEHRQLLAFNAAYLDGLNVDNADDILGLRPGEAIHCTHSDDHPGGCGTGPHCRTCGAAIAIVAAQRTGKPVQRECLLTATNHRGHPRSYSFLVRAAPCADAKEHLTVLSLSDISTQKLNAGLERAFLHDMSNVVGALNATAELLRGAPPAEATGLLEDLSELTQRLTRELVVQKLLLSENPSQYRRNWQQVPIQASLNFMKHLFANHHVASGKQLTIEQSLEARELTTEPTLFERVLTNMVTNAFEASGASETVKLTATSTSDSATFTVWNSACMDDAVASRVFQRFFSTKAGLGRGQGTYAMKLIGETLLRGSVTFSTARTTGTTFTFVLPLRPLDSKGI